MHSIYFGMFGACSGSGVRLHMDACRNCVALKPS